jgi:hypothetical protein
MDQLALAFTPPDIGDSYPPEAIAPIDGLNARLTATHADLVARFRDLELACGRVPNAIATEVDAATAIDFIAKCQLPLNDAEAARKQEKAFFLRGGRAIDAFFRAHCERLNAALAPRVARRKAYRGRVTAAERQRHEPAGKAAEDARQAFAEGETHRAQAERLSEAGQSFEQRDDGAEALRLAAEAAEGAEVARKVVSAPLQPTRIRGNCGALAFVRRSWSFEVVDLELVPRQYMSLDVQAVRGAITQDRIRQIPGLRIIQTEGLRVRAKMIPRSHKAPSQREQAVETSKSAEAASASIINQTSPGRRTPRPRGCIRSGSDSQLMVPIRPIWGDQKVLRYYRQAPASLRPHHAAEIAKFHAANAAIEARLRRKLPHRMEEIEFLYGGSRVSPVAGEGTPK